MSNIKNIAEELIQLTNKSHKLDEAIHLLKIYREYSSR